MTIDFLFKPRKEEGALYGWEPDFKRKKAFETEQIERAKNFYEKGLSRSEKGDLRGGWISLGRAARLLPDEPHISFAYALSCLNIKAPELALKRMTALLEGHDYRGAAFGRVSAFFQMRDLEKAVTAMADSLARFSVGEDIWSFVLFLAQQAGYAGGSGFLLPGEIWLSGRGDVSLYLDGRLFKKLTLSGEGKKIISLPSHWKKAERLLIKGEGRGFLGGEIDLLAMRRMKSLAWQKEANLYAWLEYPADPDFEATPVCVFQTQKTEMLKVHQGKPLYYQGLGNPKIYSLPSPAKEDISVEVEDYFQRSLWGSPLAAPPTAGFVPQMASARPGKPAQGRDFMIIVPVHGKEMLVKRTISALLKTLPLNESANVHGEILVVNDASPEKSLGRYLRKLAKEKKIIFLENKTQKGFAASVNLALQQADGRDVILFNSDAVAFEDWALRLLTSLRHKNAGTVTPYGNEAGQMSFPQVQDHPISLSEARKLDRLFKETGSHQHPIELVTGNGFCMGISAECLEKTGGITEGIFAQAYGEEVDFCLRATGKGFKHFSVENLYVYHEGRGSIGQAGSPLFFRNQEILENLHPAFPLKVWKFEKADPLGRYRRLISEKCLQKKVRTAAPILLVSHAIGGGVTRYIAQRQAILKKEGKTPLLIIPTREGCRLGLIAEDGTVCAGPETISFALPQEHLLLIGLLRRLKISAVEYHNFVGHSEFVQKLAEQLEIAPSIFIHDHASFCPHITLIGDHGRYCGEPDVKSCQACAIKSFKKANIEAANVSLPDVSKHLQKSLMRMQNAQKILTPSQDSKQRLKRHFPSIRPEILLPENDIRLFEKNSAKREQRKRRLPHHVWRIGVVGALSVWKGAVLLEKIAQASKSLSLPIKFFLIGHAINEKALEEAGVEITGAFAEDEIESLLSIFDFDAVLLPSIAPETWGYAFSHVLAAGLFTFCFDIGSVAERIRFLGDRAGFVMPLGFPPERIGRFLVEKLQHR